MSSLLYYGTILIFHTGQLVTAVQSKSGAHASLLVKKYPPFPWTFALILYHFLLEKTRYKIFYFYSGKIYDSHIQYRYTKYSLKSMKNKHI